MDTVASRSRAEALAVVRAVPVWAWLACIVILSAGLRFWLARKVVAPWIFVDELIYSELAKSFAAGGHFLVRGESTSAYGFVYPVLIAPAWRLYASVPSAYEAAKGINSVLMSVAAVPAYFLARRSLAPGLSLAAAVVTLAIPSMAYTSTIMTENAFYPAFVLVALALALVLESPTWQRQVLLLALCALAFFIRTQAVVLLPAVLTAPVLLAWMGGRWRGLREYRVVWGAAIFALVVLPLVEVARGKSPLALFGAYEKAGQTHYSISSVLRWLLYHVAELDLYLGVIPFAALLVLLALSRRLAPRVQIFVAVTVALSFWLLLEVAAFASRNPIPPRVEERNMFYVAPLFVIALLVWIDQALPRPRVAAAVAAVAAVALPAFLPYSTLIGVNAQADELALSIWWRLQDNTISLSHVWVWVTVCGLVAALLFLFLPRRLAALLPITVFAIFFAVSWTTMDYTHGFQRASVGALFQGDTNPYRDWIDRAVGHDSDVAIVWTACASKMCAQPRSLTDDKVVWENEFFSRSVGDVYYLHDPSPGGLPEKKLTFDARSGFFRSGGAKIDVPYALVDASVLPVGTKVAEDTTKGTFVYRLDGPLRQAEWVRGRYADGWIGRRLEYVRRGCVRANLAVTVAADPSLIGKPQQVVVTSRGRVVLRATVPPSGISQVLKVPLRPRGGICDVSFSVSPTKVPGKHDLRRLGLRVQSIVYTPRA
jgi:Dolichyl-phosphate-mannose-protein mannosyltransferase